MCIFNLGAFIGDLEYVRKLFHYIVYYIAFRIARVIAMTTFKKTEEPLLNRFLIKKLIFAVVWRYFAWSDQTFVTVVFNHYHLLDQIKTKYWISFVPAVFMTAMVTSYLFIAPEGFGLNKTISYAAGLAADLASIVWIMTTIRKRDI